MKTLPVKLNTKILLLNCLPKFDVKEQIAREYGKLLYICNSLFSILEVFDLYKSVHTKVEIHHLQMSSEEEQYVTNR